MSNGTKQTTTNKPTRYRQAADHNGEQWLEVRFLTATGRGMLPMRPAGWYVVRTCPCHSGMPVTLPFDDAVQAERARQAILAVPRKLAE